MSNGVFEGGILLSVGTASPVPENIEDDIYMNICNIISIEMNGAATEEIDVTALSSDAKEYISGFSDSGSWTVNGFWLPGDETQQRLKYMKDNRIKSNFCVTLPDDGMGNGAVKYYAKGEVMTLNLKASAGAAAAFTGTIRISGLVTEVLPNI